MDDPRDFLSLHDALSDRDAQIAEQRDSINALQKVAAQVGPLQSTLSRLERDLERAKSKNADLIGENAIHDTNNRTLQASLAHAREKIHEQEQAIEAAKTASDKQAEAEDEALKLQREVASLTQALKESRAECDRLRPYRDKLETLRSLLK